jgi:uncharacterized protein
MFQSLKGIQKPLNRGLTGALAVFSATTLAAAIVIGATNSKNESIYKTAFYSALIGAGCGALLSLILPHKEQQLKSNSALTNSQSTSSTDPNFWQDWRNFIVVRKVKESEEITSFYLQPQDSGSLPNFQPGQFLTIKLEIPGQAKPVIRTYSLSDYTASPEYYRLSIKREPTPPGLDVMPGIASNFMHDQVHEGSIIPAKPPSGRFILDVQKSIPAILLSNGVGITPMISMAKAATCLNPKRSIWFVHGARDGKFHAFRDEVTAIAQQNPNLKLHFAYSRPRIEDEGHYHSIGYVDTPLIQSLVMQEAEYFLCGSPTFLASLREGLKNAGVPKSRIFFEMFTKASRTIEPSSIEGSSDAEVTFARSQKTVAWDANADNLLEFAEANNLEPPYSCRQGICGTCECKILEGEVTYQTPPTATIKEGSVLICISTPKTSKIILDL